MLRVFRKAVQVLRVLTGRQDAGRNLTVFPDDLFIVSYPRSGNNWTRFLIGNLLHPEEPVTFANLERRVPEIYFSPDRSLRALPRPRVFKSHEAFEPHYPLVLYVVRDPRDVAVSNYHHNQKAGNIPSDCKIDDFIPMFLAGKFDKRCGTWADHVTSWLATRENRQGFCLLRYEDLKANPVATLARIAGFLEDGKFRGIDRSERNLQRVIELSSADNMRALEKAQGGAWTRSHTSRENRPYLAVRAAVTGGWKSVLPPRCVEQIEMEYGTVMQKLGYELVSSGRPDR
jgi:hypothetical protein